MSKLKKSSSGKLENYKSKFLIKEIEVGIIWGFYVPKYLERHG